MNYTQMWLFVTNQSEPLRQTSLLMLLAGGVGNGEALLQTLRAHEQESKGNWAGKVGQLRQLLEQGHTLSSALTIISGILPDQTVTAIQVAEGTAALPDVLMDEARRISSVGRHAGAPAISLETLFVWVPSLMTVLAFIVTFQMIFIVPKFKAIFIGFGVRLPPVTESFISLNDWLLSYWYIFAMPVAASVCVLIWLGYSSQKQRLMRGYHRFANRWPRYWVPGLLRNLSLSAATENPVSVALDSTMRLMPEGRAAVRFSELRYRVLAGEDTVVAMQSLGLLRQSEAAFLQSSIRTHHVDWSLRHLADGIERRRDRWFQRMVEVAGPVVILLMGAMVLFTVVALFLPLVQLIGDLATVECGGTTLHSMLISVATLIGSLA